MGAWTARGGWSTPCYRVLRHGYRIAYCASLDELRELLEMNGLDLGDLVEDDPECELPRHSRRRANSVKVHYPTTNGHPVVKIVRRE